MPRLDGRIAIVTGAGSGIGREVALHLAAEGARVVAADIDQAGADETAKLSGGPADSVTAVRVDVTDRSSVRQMVSHAVQTHGGLDVAFNIAGVNTPARFLDVDEQNYHTIMNVNVLGVLLCMQEAARAMIAQGRGGKIVNIASVAGRAPLPDSTPYSASKAAVIALVQAGARALAEHGITVNAFSPGVVQTPLIASNLEDFARMDPTGQTSAADIEAGLSSGILLGRTATPADMIGIALFLASPDSDYLTGQTIQVDGGMVLV